MLKTKTLLVAAAASIAVVGLGTPGAMAASKPNVLLVGGQTSMPKPRGNGPGVKGGFCRQVKHCHPSGEICFIRTVCS